MKLVEISIENFYGFEQKASIKACDFNVLVGRNDVGKSSVLKALDLFLNDKTPSAETSN
jgi:predicted ATP-dependent endonuclease of OLD family